MPEVQLLVRGDPESPQGDGLAPAAVSALAMLDPHLGTLQSTEGDRRAALAHWITDSANPLTSRVIVNRLWQWHFGRGLVATSSDFGFGGDRPTHPELLDWLSAELIRSGGSLKGMHRLIVTSQTYRQQSKFTPDSRGKAIDEGNRWLWRQNPRRIEAEAIRDAVLVASGKMNHHPGGPGFEDFTYQEAYAPIYTYITADEPRLWRRSIYRYIVRTTPNRFLMTLDAPDPANMTPMRSTTTTALQSLALYNNEFMLKQSQYFAARVEAEAGDQVGDQVRQAFLIAFGRRPSNVESAMSASLVDQIGLFALCRSLLNANEFVVID